MPQTIEAIYEDGVFKPLGKIKLPEHGHFRLSIVPTKEDDIQKLVERQKKALKKLIGIGQSGLADVSNDHDKYIYEKD